MQAGGDLLYGIDLTVYPFTINVLDLETRECRVLGEFMGSEAVDSVFSFMYIDGAFGMIGSDLFLGCYSWDTGEVYLYKFNVETCESALLDRSPKGEVKWMHFDSKNGYIYKNDHDHYNDKEKDSWGFYVYNIDLEPVQAVLYKDMPELPAYIELLDCWQTDNYIFACEYYKEMDVSKQPPPTWYIDKSEIGTGSLQWRRWEP